MRGFFEQNRSYFGMHARSQFHVAVANEQDRERAVRCTSRLRAQFRGSNAVVEEEDIEDLERVVEHDDGGQRGQQRKALWYQETNQSSPLASCLTGRTVRLRG